MDAASLKNAPQGPKKYRTR